jgi:hypothetical protein
MVRDDDPRKSPVHDKYVAAAKDLADTLDTLRDSDFVPRLSAWAAIVDVDQRNFRAWLKANLPQLLERHAAARERHEAWQLEQYRAGRTAGEHKHVLHQRLGLPLKLCHGLDPCKSPAYDWPGLFARHRAWLAEPRTLKETADKMGVLYNSLMNLRQRRGLPSWVGCERVGMPLLLWDKKAHKRPSHADR